MPSRTPGLWLLLLNHGGCLVPVLPRLGMADVTARHEGLNALAAEPVTRFPSPCVEGFAHKFKALIQRRSRAGLLAEPAPEGPSERPLLLLLEWKCLRKVCQHLLLREVNESLISNDAFGGKIPRL